MHFFLGALRVNSLLASCDFCHLLLTFANSLDPDQDRQKIGADLDPSSLTLISVLVRIVLKSYF